MKNNKKQLNFALLIYACSVHAKISLFVLTVFILSHACKCENLCEYFHNIKRGFIYLILKGYLFTDAARGSKRGSYGSSGGRYGNK